ncbi:hypothetical protein DN069_23965 [Streptacidiphilus pinicola]|uniref:Uncharacterized protein n=1 Tax=Streptacidiphilus pinicola TaxID=2219663 RepID=A0A2X0J6P1_9ACTN|nr:hypothetical protein [Streptacidiphilus pinicola]RAG83098.1 hypothetical protein DN069_23965 [Streptacidiphilus pinicola]
MTFEREWARKSTEANRRFVDKAVVIAREVEVVLGRESMTYPRHPVQRARDALADRLFAILAAARDASTTFYNVDQVAVAIVSDEMGDNWVDPVADAVGTLAATMARAATVLTGMLGSDLSDTTTGPWVNGVLDDVRNAAGEVIRRAGGSAAPQSDGPTPAGGYDTPSRS